MVTINFCKWPISKYFASIRFQKIDQISQNSQIKVPVKVINLYSTLENTKRRSFWCHWVDIFCMESRFCESWIPWLDFTDWNTK